jgi:uncharacterized Fe-S center protein
MSEKTFESVKSILNEMRARLQDLEKRLEEILKNEKSSVDIYSNLPWKPYKSGNGQWIRAENASELLQKLKQAKGNVIFTDEYRYVLSKDQRFIGRFRRAKQANPVHLSTKHE